MNKSFLLVTISSVLLFFYANVRASTSDKIKLITTVMHDTSMTVANVMIFKIPGETKDSLSPTNLLYKKEIRRKKMVSALFAFPFPFGFMGAHRIMLGTKPWVPIVYAATFGGCFGILPMIDFLVIVFSKDIEQYENNPRIFMWLK